MIKKESSRDNSEPQMPDLLASLQRDMEERGERIEFPRMQNYGMNVSLSLDAGGSLALNGRHSIENGIPIPHNMLSRQEDAFQLQNRQYHQNESVENQIIKLEQQQPNAQDLIKDLGLADFVTSEITTENTKNVLRNFGNAQNHYCLYNARARKFIKRNISDPKQFDRWVRTLRLENFENFKSAWVPSKSRLFTRVYKKLCWDFYSENAIPYVLTSRIKKAETKNSHLRYIFRFLQGLRDPEDFTYFKKV